MPPNILIVIRNRKFTNETATAISSANPILAKKYTAATSLTPKPPIEMGIKDMALITGTITKIKTGFIFISKAKINI